MSISDLRKLNYEVRLFFTLIWEELLAKAISLEDQVINLRGRVINYEKSESTKPIKPMDFSKFTKRRIALKILYTGWDYSGLARQDSSKCTIAENLIIALCKCRLIEDPGAIGFAVCGRTDKGVSGLSQVVALTVRSNVHDGVGIFYCDLAGPEKPEVDYVLVVNKNLPKDIRVLSWCPVPLEFNPRHDCLSRSYKYFFPAADLDIKLMRTASIKLIGLHDFRNFCSSQVNNGVVNHERVIYEIKIIDESEDKTNPRRFCCLYIKGTAFLYHQIRCIASLLIAIGRKIESPEILDALLDVEKFPGKPQYQMAEPEPLLFFEPEFENIEWQTSPAAQEDIVKCVQKLWTQTNVSTPSASLIDCIVSADDVTTPELATILSVVYYQYSLGFERPDLTLE
ncbi:hypothetical protein ACTXT7_008646 [Hymenolepis weldensis]